MQIALVLLAVTAALAPAVARSATFNHSFTYTDSSGSVFFAGVGDSRVVLRERDVRANGKEGELTCPLSQDLRATSKSDGNTPNGGGIVCVKFANPSCALRRVDGTGKDIRHIYGFSSFCVNTASPEQAQQVANLINRNANASHTKGPSGTPPATSDAVARNAVVPSKPSPPAKLADRPPARAREPKVQPLGAHDMQANLPERGVVIHERDLKREEKRWLVRQFRITYSCNEQMMASTYAMACIVDDRGAASVTGDYIFIRNRSDKYPLYYGLSREPKEKLEPGEEVEFLVRDSRNDTRPTRQLITVRWFNSGFGENEAQ